mgnify:CR=1 FL=1
MLAQQHNGTSDRNTIKSEMNDLHNLAQLTLELLVRRKSQIFMLAQLGTTAQAIETL